MRTIILSLGGWIIMTCAVFGQQGQSPFIHHLTIDNGLLEITNDFIYKDQKGFVWISTINGLNRYDGKMLEPYQEEIGQPHSLYGQNIQSPFFELDNGNLLFTTYKGINLYHRKTEEFEHFVLPDSQNFYYAFHLDLTQRLWFVNNDNNICIFDSESHDIQVIDSIPANVQRVDPFINPAGEITGLWCYSYQKPGVVIMKRQGGRFVLQAPSKHSLIQSSEFRQILFDDAGYAWMASNQGLLKYDPKADVVSTYLIDGLSERQINAVSFLGKDTLLVAVKDHGLYYFDTKRATFFAQIQSDVANPHSLSSANVNKIYVDEDGGVWLSITGVGIDFFYPSKTKFHSFQTEDASIGGRLGLPVSVGIEEDKAGQIWCATELNGIYVFNQNKKQVGHVDNAATSSGLIYIYSDRKGRIWTLAWDNITLWNANGQPVTVKETNLSFIRMLELADGRLLLSCFEGELYEVIESATKEIEIVPIKGPTKNKVFTALWQDSAGLLYACHDLSRIVVMDPERHFKEVQSFAIPGDVESFYENPQDGSIWVANSNGLVRLDVKKSETVFFTEKNGLPDRVVHGILPVGDSVLWLSTNRGLASFKLSDFSVKQYRLADGLPSLVNYSLACQQLKNGELLFGTPNGITYFRPSDIQALNIAAQPVITRILVNDEEGSFLVADPTGTTNVHQIRDLILPYESNTLSFNFAALEYSDPSSNQFEYKMEGIDDAWVKSYGQNFTRYANMDHGDFTFKLRASNSDGVFSEPVELKISITPPFMRTPLFYSLVSVFVVGLIWLIFYIRRQRLEEKRRMEEEKRTALELERQRIARDVHDDLGSGLSALSLQTAMAQYKSSPQDLKADLSKIHHAARDLSGKIREVIWTVSSKNDTLANLLSYLNQYALDLLESNELDLSINFPDDIPEYTLTGEYRRTTFLAFKEALNNLLKHANATEVTIDFSIVGHSLALSVADNGVGFDPELLKASTGNGLLNMQSRMKEIGGQCQFATSSDGTKIIFTVPVLSK